MSSPAVAAIVPPPGCVGGVWHPLEMFPVFRRWRRSAVRDIVYTLVWNAMIAVIFTGLALLFDARVRVVEALRVNMAFAQCIGFVIHGMFALGDRILPGIHRKRMAVRFVYYTAVPIVGAFLGYWAGAELLGSHDFVGQLLTARGFSTVAFLSMLISGILLLVFAQRERTARATATLALEQARVAAAERAAATARLKLLEAQVEPHFLFNTLAHVVSLVDTDPARARHMIERLIDLLRTTAAAPDGAGTLAEQLRWLRAYLAILELRMGARLQWDIDVPDDLLGIRVAPMLLQPIVENAVKHGLEPKIEGGRLDIRARRQGEDVELTVKDTGLGFRATKTAGSDPLGIANLRARLLAWYGPGARLVIEDNPPGGASVTLVLPVVAAG